MKSIRNLADQPASIPVVADDVLEFHAARLLMLFKICGIGGRIDGLTKMAKLDFFVRYPQFFDELCESLGEAIESHVSSVESSMVRYHYGPWDKGYYQVLGYLESKKLVDISKVSNSYQFALTDAGKEIAKKLEADPAFADLSEQMKRVKKVLGGKAGSTIKNLIYKVFDEEVAKRSLGEVIR
jgi:hypothetical protein